MGVPTDAAPVQERTITMEISTNLRLGVRRAVAAAGLALLLTACGGSRDAVAPGVLDPADAGQTAPAPAADAPDADAPADDVPVDDVPAGDDGAAAQPADGQGGDAGTSDDCSAAGHTVAPVAAGDLPAEVVALRDLLIDAALRCDEQLLRTAIDESGMFTYSFGGGDDAIGHWRMLEEQGEQPYLRLAQVLATTPAVADSGDVVVWPQVTTGRPEATTPEAWAELTWLTEDEIRAHQGEAGYLDWRVGISLDGEWRFFVIGD